MILPSLWHMKLGYVGEKFMQALSKQGLMKSAKTCKLKFCEHYVFGKKTKVKFGTAVHRTKEFLITCIRMFGVPLRMHLLEKTLFYLLY